MRLLKSALLVAALQFPNAPYAQSSCYDFELACDDSVSSGLAFSEPFFQGCVPDWNAAYGTPQILNNSAFIGLWHTCGDVIGEGIVLENIPFTGCVDIRFNYKVSEATNILKYTLQLFAISGAFPGVTVQDLCEDDNWEITDPGGLVPIWEATEQELQNGQDYSITTVVTIPENTQQLWFRIAPLPDAVLADGDHASIYIDDFCYLTCDFCEDTVVEDVQGNKDCLRNDALFFLETDVDQGVYSLYPEDYETFEDLLGEHSWRVLTSGTEAGPYQDLGVFAIEDFPMVMEEGLFYTVIHTVNYVCGEFCYLERTCSTSVTCDDCGPICCDAELDLCNPKGPSGLSCEYKPGQGIILVWNAIPGVVEYEVDFVEVINPYSFCLGPGSGLYGPAVDFMVVTNSIPEPANISQCYNFRVRAICNGSPGEWSGWYSRSGYGLCKIGPGEDGPGFPGDPRLQGINGDDPVVYPNPSASFFNIIIPKYDESTKIRIFDFSGREIYKKVRESREDEPLAIRWTPSSTQRKGIYLVLIEQGENVTTHKLILQ